MKFLIGQFFLMTILALFSLNLMADGWSGSDGSETLSCGEGTIQDGTECIVAYPEIKCGDGTVNVDGVCLPEYEFVMCGENTVLVENVCIAECDSGGCSENSDCGDGEYCEKVQNSCGDIDTKGECVIQPDVCPMIFAPICGCDGETYGNRCRAAASGVNAYREGVCETPIPLCGSNDECADNEYCKKEMGNCSEMRGECVERPNVCPMIYAPVCGCDGETWVNRCQAAISGVNAAVGGVCE